MFWKRSGFSVSVCMYALCKHKTGSNMILIFWVSNFYLSRNEIELLFSHITWNSFSVPRKSMYAHCAYWIACNDFSSKCYSWVEKRWIWINLSLSHSDRQLLYIACQVSLEHKFIFSRKSYIIFFCLENERREVTCEMLNIILCTGVNIFPMPRTWCQFCNGVQRTNTKYCILCIK